MVKKRLPYFIWIMLLCAPAIGGLQMEAGNHTDLKNEPIAGLVSNLVTAVNTYNREAVLLMLHPERRKQRQYDDVALP